MFERFKPKRRHFWEWHDGARRSGYQKLLLAYASRPWMWELLLLRYTPGVGLPPHTDRLPVGKLSNWRHYRLNIVVKRAKQGGEFVMHEGRPIFKCWRVYLFRADQYLHEVKPIIEGTRYVLNLGVILPPKDGSKIRDDNQ